MLPDISYPTYEMKIPSSGKEITVRPFLVKEEKLLLMAAKSNDVVDIINATKQVVANCILNDDVNIDTLPFFDVDYLFIALRAKSIGESIDVNFTCKNVTGEDGAVCNNVFKSNIDVANVALVKNPEVVDLIDIGNKKIRMTYPPYSVMKRLTNDEDNAIEDRITLIANCISQIVDGNNVYSAKKDFTIQEAKDFVEKMTEAQFKKLEVYIDNFPHFYVKAEGTCSKCGFHHHIAYDDFESFFLS